MAVKGVTDGLIPYQFMVRLSGAYLSEYMYNLVEYTVLPQFHSNLPSQVCCNLRPAPTPSRRVLFFTVYSNSWSYVALLNECANLL